MKLPIMNPARMIGPAGLLLISGAGCDQTSKNKVTKPNLLIIHTDEHNFRTLGCYRSLLPQDQGYATGYAGKWHLDGVGRLQWAPERKFGFADNRYMFNRGHWKQLIETPRGPRVATHNPNGAPNYAVEGADSVNFTTDFLTRITMEFIREHKDSSFCFMVSIPDPHGPNTVRSPYDTLFSHLPFRKPVNSFGSDEELPAWGKKAKTTAGPQQMARYFGMVKCIDENIGKIITCLQEEGLIDRTLIVFTSDHGDLCGEHGLDNKSVPFETSAGIPFIISYPGHLPQGKVVDATLGCVDFQPTILTLMGQPHSGKEEGRDASELFLSDKMPSDWDDIVFMRGTGNDKGTANKWVSAVSGPYKLIYSEIGNDQPWLFDLEIDPNELTNEYFNPEYQEIVQSLSEKLLNYGKRYNDPRVLSEKISKEIQVTIQ